jgi:c-di-GMP-binding flagellar brake protein YcgR
VNNLVIPVVRKGVPTLSDALDQIAADASAHEMRDQYDIGEALDLLARTGEAVSVYPSRLKKNLVMARIHSVDPEHPHFVIDFAEGVPAPGMATLVAALGSNAKIQFDLLQEWHSLPGQPNLVPVQFPDSCLVLNRRAGPRLETPVGVNYNASFRIQGRPYELALSDYSVGGVGLRAAPEEAIGLRVGKRLTDVRLQFGPAMGMTVDLEVRLVRPFRTYLLGDQVQIGCSFADLPSQLRERLETLIKITGGRVPELL